MQLKAEKGVPMPRNPYTVVKDVYAKEGIRALYKGCGPLVLVSFGVVPFVWSRGLHVLFPVLSFVHVMTASLRILLSQRSVGNTHGRAPLARTPYDSCKCICTKRM